MRVVIRQNELSSDDLALLSARFVPAAHAYDDDDRPAEGNLGIREHERHGHADGGWTCLSQIVRPIHVHRRES